MKGIKASVQEAARTSWLGTGKEPPAVYGDNAKRYAAEQDELQRKAKDLERERDDCIEKSDHLLHRHHRFASSVVLLQVSIALGAMAALTRQRWIWVASLLSGLTGVGVFLLTSLKT